MFETKYSKFLTVLLIIIIIGVVGLLGYLGYTYYNNYSINTDSDQFVETFIEEVGDEGISSEDGNVGSEEGNLSSGIESASSSSSTSSQTKKYKGFNVLGTIEIPKTNVKYPVLEEPDTVKKLEVAVAARYPINATLNTVGNVVIAGHNYRNSLFFSNNKKLSVGDKIYITDLTGKKLIYKIYNVFIAEENDASYYNKDTDGKIEITLVTCTDDSSQRLVVEAVAE